ncbi:hypothetical protein HPB51_027480 [Rhipicephalus microplus]|uniref:Uncharacterized protein n=1 Tax=Rhipicephalus microplus TaxID=6941 RepID=A0A9J6CZZ1_RHIMP|nr:hypothetical protein HPB51_027480 [Rhipicephalus microplus]
MMELTAATLSSSLTEGGYFKEAYSPAEESPRKPTGAFQRIVFAGSFLVTEPIMQSDVPPGDIWNPEVVQVRSGANHTLEVQVSWKWPGAHMTFGNASAVDIRASKDVTKLDKEFEKQKRMTAADVVQGNLDPLPAGRKHEVTLMFPSEWAEREPSGALWWAIFLAARVANSDGLTSNRFHIMRVLYLTPPARTTGATTTTVATTTVAGVEGKPKSRGLSQPLVWFLISGIAVVVVIAAVLVVLSRSSAKNHIV